MKNQVSGLDLHYIVQELKLLIDGKIDKIYNPQKNELLLQIHIPNTGKKILRISTPDFMYLTSYKPKQDAPSGFCTFLRKKLSSARIRSIEQKDFERVVEIVLETKDGKFSLIIELFSKGNILLLQDNIILSAIDYQIWKDRTIKPKEEYKYPKRDFNFLKITEKEFIELLKGSDKESIVKTLAMDLGLGGLYAEEACHLAGIDKDLDSKKIKDQKKLFKLVDSLRNKKTSPSIAGLEILPFNLESKKSVKTEFVSFNELLDSKLTKATMDEVESELKKEKNKELDKVKRIIDSQESTIKKLEKKEAEEREKAEAIYNNYQTIKDMLDQIIKAKEKLSLIEIKEKLKSKNIDLNTKEKTITVELK